MKLSASLFIAALAVIQPFPALAGDPLPTLLGAAKAACAKGNEAKIEEAFPLAGAEARLKRLVVAGRLRRLSLELWDTVAAPPLPLAVVTLSADCAPIEARRIDRGGPMGPELVRFAPDLSAEIGREFLDPPVPPGKDPGGVAVAHVDTGVNYLLPQIAKRLARDGAGNLLGGDFWDNDRRPFDVDTGRSPFFPLHHGTAVVSIVLTEAPAARIAPYRFPRPDMNRMAALVADIDASKIRIVNMAMGSNDRGDWIAFAEAASKVRHILFVVSAGNDGRDIDARPVWPAALVLDNMIVVTSADSFGRLAEGSNWGVKSVDVMVPGERIVVTDHRGAEGRASGSSFAVPRVTAMAARLLAKNPDWMAPELKKAILARARVSPYQKTPVVRVGWIPDPTDDY